MKLIDASRAYDGQGAFRNGLHDAILVPREPCLYRKGYPGAVLNRALWFLGRLLGRLPFMRSITRTYAGPRVVRRKAAA